MPIANERTAHHRDVLLSSTRRRPSAVTSACSRASSRLRSPALRGATWASTPRAWGATTQTLTWNASASSDRRPGCLSCASRRLHLLGPGAAPPATSRVTPPPGAFSVCAPAGDPWRALGSAACLPSGQLRASLKGVFFLMYFIWQMYIWFQCVGKLFFLIALLFCVAFF